MSHYIRKLHRRANRLVLILTAGLFLSNGCCPKSAARSPGGSFGLTDPVRLLTFRMPSSATWEQYESYCPRDEILRGLKVWLGDQPDCSARLLDGGSSGDLLEMRCTIATEHNSCTQEYLAWMWAEQVSSSTTDYDVLGYSRVRRVCPWGSVYAADWEAEVSAREESQGLQQFLDGCRRVREVAHGG